MTRRKTFALIAIAIGTALAAVGFRAEAAGTNPFAGTFVMNAAKSTANPGPLPKSAKVTTEELADGKIKTSTETVLEDGTVTKTESTYAYDGKDYPIAGSPNVETVAVKRVDDNTLEITQKKGGAVIGTGTVKASADGKTINTSFSGTAPDGNQTSATAVYERQ